MANISVRFAQTFYHYDLGRLPKGNDKKKVVELDEKYIPDLPSGTVIVKGTDEQKAALAKVFADREAARAKAKANAKVQKEADTMQAFVGAMQAMQAAMAATPVKAAAPADAEEDDAPARRRRRSE